MRHTRREGQQYARHHSVMPQSMRCPEQHGDVEENRAEHERDRKNQTYERQNKRCAFHTCLRQPDCRLCGHERRSTDISRQREE